MITHYPTHNILDSYSKSPNGSINNLYHLDNDNDNNDIIYDNNSNIAVDKSISTCSSSNDKWLIQNGKYVVLNYNQNPWYNSANIDKTCDLSCYRLKNKNKHKKIKKSPSLSKIEENYENNNEPQDDKNKFNNISFNVSLLCIFLLALMILIFKLKSRYFK